MPTLIIWLSNDEWTTLLKQRGENDKRTPAQTAKEILASALAQARGGLRLCAECGRQLEGYVIQAGEQHLCSLVCLESHLNKKLATAVALSHRQSGLEFLPARFTLALAPRMLVAKGGRLLPVVRYDTNSKRRPRQCGHCGQPWGTEDVIEGPEGRVLVGAKDNVARVSYHWRCCVPDPGAVANFRQELMAFVVRWQLANAALAGNTPIRIDGLKYDIVRL